MGKVLYTEADQTLWLKYVRGEMSYGGFRDGLINFLKDADVAPLGFSYFLDNCESLHYHVRRDDYQSYDRWLKPLARDVELLQEYVRAFDFTNDSSYRYMDKWLRTFGSFEGEWRSIVLGSGNVALLDAWLSMYEGVDDNFGYVVLVDDFDERVYRLVLDLNVLDYYNVVVDNTQFYSNHSNLFNYVFTHRDYWGAMLDLRSLMVGRGIFGIFADWVHLVCPDYDGWDGFEEEFFFGVPAECHLGVIL